MSDKLKTLGIDDLKSLLAILKAKRQHESVRLLDQFELSGGAPGASCVMQVMCYETGKWLPCELKGKDTYSLAHWNKVIRCELGWDGAIRLCVAA